MAIVISPEAQAKAEQIPDFMQRLERFINDQYALEQWRAHQFRTVLTSLDAGASLVYQ